MADVSMCAGWFADRTRITVERTISEFRAGRPVLVRAEGETLRAVAVEGFDRCMIHQAADRPADPLADASVGRTGPGWPGAPASGPEDAAVEPARLALVPPAVRVVRVESPSRALQDLPGVVAEEVFAYRRPGIGDLRLVSRAAVPLDGGPDTEFVVLRIKEGLRDRAAIPVKAPDPAGTVESGIHSACLTDDLFGSLRCDCGSGLRRRVKQMAEREGGILLHLDHEGHGKGIADGSRARGREPQGRDARDAAGASGSGLDPRRSEPGAAMLCRLAARTVQVLTGAPLKVAALRAASLTVVSTQQVPCRAAAEHVNRWSFPQAAHPRVRTEGPRRRKTGAAFPDLAPAPMRDPAGPGIDLDRRVPRAERPTLDRDASRHGG